jgi:predicted O-methyltransferase YrrM
VHWETGRFLATLCRALDPNVLEVGTAIGYSTLHLPEQLASGRVVTLEIDPDRARQAREFWDRAGVADGIELFEGDARDTIPACRGRSTCSSSTPPRASTATTSSWPSRCCGSAPCS